MPTRSPRDRPGRWPCALSVVAFVMTQIGCAAVDHVYSAADLAGRSLATRSAEGSDRLRRETEFDVTIRDFVQRHGKPDYLHIVDRTQLYLFYVEEDRAVRFDRDLIPPSRAEELGRIPGSLLRWLPKRDVDRILVRRKSVQRRHAARQRSRRPALAPAAPAPSGFVARGFDVKRIIERMRPPMSAADPGVSGWRQVRFSDGVTGGTAQAGALRYEVRSDRLVVAAPIAASGTRVPPSLRLGVARANQAVFGAQAAAVTEHVLKLARGVARDRSGGSPAAQRLRGRTVRVDRASGSLVYAIYP